MLIPALEQKLQSAGWTPNRRVDDAQVSDWLRVARQDVGCHVFPEAVRILRAYGGLVIGEGRESSSSVFHIDPSRIHIPDDPESWFLWEWGLREVLFPIGSLGNFDLSFSVASSGKIYSYGLGDYEYGASFEEALANLLLPGRSDFVRELIEVIHNRCTPSNEEEALSIYRAINSAA